MKNSIIMLFLLLLFIPTIYGNTITLREKSLENKTIFFINLANFKHYQANVSKSGNFYFPTENDIGDTGSNEFIQIQICDKDSFSYEILSKNNYTNIDTYCEGIIGYFNLIKGIKNLKIELNPDYIFGDQVGNQFEVKCKDKYLTFCSIILAEGFTILNYQVETIKNGSEEHRFNVIPLYNLSKGVYSLSLLASDDLNPILSIKQFSLEIVNITNPYNLPAIGNFEINESNCFFSDNNKKSINVSYKPNEKKTISIHCPEKGLQTNPQINKNFVLKSIINLSNFILSFIVSFIFYLIIYLIHNPKSTKKSFTKKLLVLSVIVGILLYLLLQYIKFNI